MIPTSIDGTDITGATIDGTDVTEITVDGTTVFTSTVSPIAQSNLIGWWPFENGGQDETASNGILGGSGVANSSDFSFQVNGNISFNSSGGITDINNGTSSGEATGVGSSSDYLTTPTLPTGINQWTVMAWFEGLNSNRAFSFGYDSSNSMFIQGIRSSNTVNIFDLGSNHEQTGYTHISSYQHYAYGYDGSDYLFWQDGDFKGAINATNPSHVNGQPLELYYAPIRDVQLHDGQMDDVRYYDTALSTSQIQQIVQNTQDPNNPVYP